MHTDRALLGAEIACSELPYVSTILPYLQSVSVSRVYTPSCTEWSSLLVIAKYRQQTGVAFQATKPAGQNIATTTMEFLVVDHIVGKYAHHILMVWKLL